MDTVLMLVVSFFFVMTEESGNTLVLKYLLLLKNMWSTGIDVHQCEL